MESSPSDKNRYISWQGMIGGSGTPPSFPFSMFSIFFHAILVSNIFIETSIYVEDNLTSLQVIILLPRCPPKTRARFATTQLLIHIAQRYRSCHRSCSRYKQPARVDRSKRLVEVSLSCSALFGQYFRWSHLPELSVLRVCGHDLDHCRGHADTPPGEGNPIESP